MCHSTAIRTALNCYNRLAPCQKPPHPKLEYSKVISYSTLRDFSLLKASCTDVLMKPWAQPANCEMTMKYFKVLQSKEEIIHLNIEVHQLAVWVDHDEREILAAKDKLWDIGSNGLAAEMQLFYAKRHWVNSIHHRIIHRIYMLDGYSSQIPKARIQVDMGKQVDDGDEDEEDEEDVTDAINLTDCLDRVN